MSESFPTRFELEQSPALVNDAVARCCAAWEPAFTAERAKGRSPSHAADEAGSAYLNAMPPLCGYENIQDFIACAAHGIILGAIDEKRGSRLLYAAQIALAAFRAEPKPPGRMKF
jgi:hypothetical protein